VKFIKLGGSVPSSHGIRAGRAFVELYADDSRLVRGLRSAQQRLAAFGAAVRQLGTQMLALGAGIVAPLALAAKSFADTGSQLNDMAARTGLSVEALGELGYAAQQSGASLEEVEKAVRTMQRTVAAAVGGSDQATAALERLGLSAQALGSLAPEQQFTAIATALRGIADPTQRAAAAMGVLGKSGTSLLPMVADLAALRAEARRLGVMMTGGQAQQADALGDAFDRVKASLQGVANAVGTALAPVLLDLAARVTGFLVGFRTWVSQNQGLVVTIATVGAAVIGLGAGLVALGLSVSGVSAGIGALASTASVAGTVMGALGAIIGALFSPIGAVIAGVAALGAVIVTQTTTGQQALGMLSGGFQTLQADAVDAWGGIADALAAGDIGLAAKILWATLTLEWERGSSVLLNLWDAAVAGFAQLFASAWYGIQEVFWTVVYALADAWDWWIGGLTKAWNTAVGWIAGKLAQLLELVGLADQGLDLRIQTETTQQNAGVDQQRQQRLVARDQNLASLAAERDAVQAGISQDLADTVMRRDAGVEQARAELDAALAQAKQQRTTVERQMQGPGQQPVPVDLPDLDALRNALDQIPATVTAEAQRLDVTGSFSAAAIGQLGVGDSTTERTAKATEETAKNTQRIARALDDSDGLTFG
jgi:hypothetical protein